MIMKMTISCTTSAHVGVFYASSLNNLPMFQCIDCGGLTQHLVREKQFCINSLLNRGNIESKLSVPRIQECHENALYKSFDTSLHLIGL